MGMRLVYGMPRVSGPWARSIKRTDIAVLRHKDEAGFDTAQKRFAAGAERFRATFRDVICTVQRVAKTYMTAWT